MVYILMPDTDGTLISATDDALMSDTIGSLIHARY